MAGTDEPRDSRALIEDTNTDTEEVLATPAVSDTEETPVTMAPPLCDSRGPFVSGSSVPHPSPPPQAQTSPPPPPSMFPVTLSASSLSYLSNPTREL